MFVAKQEIPLSMSHALDKPYVYRTRTCGTVHMVHQRAGSNPARSPALMREGGSSVAKKKAKKKK